MKNPLQHFIETFRKQRGAIVDKTSSGAGKGQHKTLWDTTSPWLADAAFYYLGQMIDQIAHQLGAFSHASAVFDLVWLPKAIIFTGLWLVRRRTKTSK